MKNQTLKDTIQALMDTSDETGKAIWRALAEELDKPKRRRVAVNLSRIDRHAEEGTVVAVPGKVLAAGSLSKPLKVAAFSFSEGALEKISLAKGEAMTLTDLLEAGVEPSKIRVMK
jgi:large subunit ribosomal protein L18e